MRYKDTFGITRKEFDAMVARDEVFQSIVKGYLRKDKRMIIDNPGKVAGLAISAIGLQKRENLWVCAVDGKHRVIDQTIISVGGHRSTVVEPLMILRWLFTRSEVVSGFFVAHNHPSGDTNPSRQDEMVTRQLFKAGKSVGIQLLDHLVVTSNDYCSIRCHMESLFA